MNPNPRKPGLSRDEHFALGRRLQAAHEIITAASVEICHAYPSSSREVAAASAVYRDMIRLRSTMDDAICREGPPNVTSFIRAYYLRHDSQGDTP